MVVWKTMSETEQKHDTRHIDMAVQEAQIEAGNQEVRCRQYCLVCSTAVKQHDYKYKYAGAGGVIVGPFCSHDCWSGWLFGGYETFEGYKDE